MKLSSDTLNSKRTFKNKRTTVIFWHSDYVRISCFHIKDSWPSSCIGSIVKKHELRQYIESILGFHVVEYRCTSYEVTMTKGDCKVELKTRVNQASQMGNSPWIECRDWCRNSLVDRLTGRLLIWRRAVGTDGFDVPSSEWGLFSVSSIIMRPAPFAQHRVTLRQICGKHDKHTGQY